MVEAVASAPDLDRQFGGTGPRTVDEAGALIDSQLTWSPARRVWAIELDGRAVGSVAVSHLDRVHDTGWVSYWLARSARGRGLARLGVLTGADWVLAHEGLHRLELGHRVNNPASCRVAVAAGFLAEGIERDKLRYGDERFDVELHARLATDPVPPGPRIAIENPPGR